MTGRLLVSRFVVGYLLGSIPFGLVFTRLAGTQDILSIGSGSIGATNVLRTGRKGLAAATLLADVLKGTVAVLLVAHGWFGPDAGLVAGVGAFLGHLFPVVAQVQGRQGRRDRPRRAAGDRRGRLRLWSAPVWLVVAVAMPLFVALPRWSPPSSAPVAALVLRHARRRVGRSRSSRVLHLHHAPRQHRAPHERHRKQDRPEGLMTDDGASA